MPNHDSASFCERFAMYRWRMLVRQLSIFLAIYQDMREHFNFFSVIMLGKW